MAGRVLIITRDVCGGMELSHRHQEGRQEAKSGLYAENAPEAKESCFVSRHPSICSFESTCNMPHSRVERCLGGPLTPYPFFRVCGG